MAGIGVIADVNAAATSKFTSTAQLIEGATRDGNGNGNASAGANLATSSYANQNNATTANAFMQAFSGGLPEAKGVETIVNISDNSNGTFNVVTDKVTTAGHNAVRLLLRWRSPMAQCNLRSTSTEIRLILQRRFIGLPLRGAFFLAVNIK